MSNEKKTLKFQMMMSPAEAKDLDDWMFKNRVRSRAEAIRRLCTIGIGAQEAFIPGLLAQLQSIRDRVEQGAVEQLELFDSGDTIAKDNLDHKEAVALSLDTLMGLWNQVELLRLNVQEQAYVVEQITANRSTMNSSIADFTRQVELQRNELRDRLIALGYSSKFGSEKE